MKLVRLPYREADAPTNMAIDFWMLSKIDREHGVWFRSYGWERPAFTFGYTQRWDEVSTRIPLEGIECCRRPSGGGIVDHRNDWTYALAISPSCHFGRQRPLDLYRMIHQALTDTLKTFGIDCGLYETDDPDNPVSCFERPSPFDVVFHQSTRKIAGAALKRTKAGVLLQGSVDRATIPDIDDKELEGRFIRALMISGELDSQEVIEFPGDPETFTAVKEFRDPDWNHRR